MHTYNLLVVGHCDKDQFGFIETISDPKGYQTSFGRIMLDNTDQIYLFATPPLRQQEAYKWEILAEGAHGCLFIIDTSYPEALDETKRVKQYLSTLVSLPTVVVAHQDQAAQYSNHQIRNLLELSQTVDIFQIDIHDREAALQTIDVLMSKVLEEHP